MPLFEIRSPRVVAGFGHRVGGPGHFPAAEVLGADGELERFWRGGGEKEEVGGHLLGIVELVGDWGVVYRDFVGVFGVG